MPIKNFIYKAIYLKSSLIFNNFNLKFFLILGLIEGLIYKFIINLKSFLIVFSIIKNLNTFLPFYSLGLIIYSIVFNIIVNLKSFFVKDIKIGI